MASSEVEIFNLALSAAGTRATVSAVDENSREALICRQWYALVRDLVQGSAPWPSITSYQRLARTATRDASGPWPGAGLSPSLRFAYAVPAQLLRPYHLQSFGRFEYRANTLFCDEEQPILFYLRRETNVEVWDHRLKLSCANMLAAHIAPQYKADPSMTESLLQRAYVMMDEVIEQSVNNDDVRHDSLPDWIAARGYGGGMPEPRFFYPFASRNIEASL